MHGATKGLGLTESKVLSTCNMKFSTEEGAVKTEIVVSDRTRFDELVAIVERGMVSFIEMGKALAELRDGKSYKAAGYATFEECCDKAFGITPRSARYTIDASNLSGKMGTIVPIPNECVARELLTIKDETKQLEVAKRATELAGPDRSMTSAHVKQAKAEVMGVGQRLERKPAPANQVIETQAEVVPTISIASNYTLAASESELAELFTIVGRTDKVISALELEREDEPVQEDFVGPVRRAWVTEETSLEELIAILISLYDIETIRGLNELFKAWIAENYPSAMSQPSASAPLPEDHQPDAEMVAASYQYGLSGGNRDRLFHRGTGPGKRWNVIKELPPHKGSHTMSNLGKELSQPYVEAFGRGVSDRNAATSTPDQP